MTPAAKGWVLGGLVSGLVIEDAHAYLTNRLWKTLAKTPFGAPWFQGSLCTRPCFLVQMRKCFQCGQREGNYKSHLASLDPLLVAFGKYVYASFNNVAVLYTFIETKHRFLSIVILDAVFFSSHSLTAIGRAARLSLRYNNSRPHKVSGKCSKCRIGFAPERTTGKLFCKDFIF